MIRRPPRSTQSRSSAASDVYKRQLLYGWAAARLADRSRDRHREAAPSCLDPSLDALVRKLVLLRNRSCVGEPVGRTTNHLVRSHGRVVRVDGADHAHRLLIQSRQLVQEGDADTEGIEVANSG